MPDVVAAALGCTLALYSAWFSAVSAWLSAVSQTRRQSLPVALWHTA